MIKFENTVNVIARRCFNTDVAIFLIKGCMDKESLFTRAACFRGLPRLWLAMTFRTLAFALVLSFGITCEAKAEIIASGDNCAADDGKSTCHWEVNDNGVLTISGNGKIREQHAFWRHSWYQYRDNITSVKIEDGITHIGQPAFYAMENITSISIPDSVTSVGWGAFEKMSGLVDFIIPDNVSTDNWHYGIWGNFTPDNFTIRCLGEQEKCLKAMGRFLRTSINCPANTCTCTSKGCPKSVSFGLATKAQCLGEMYEWNEENHTCSRLGEQKCNRTDKYYYNGNTCEKRPENGHVTCTNPSYKENDGYCDRIRYTPAEAAAVAKDDGNVVTITFKK